MKARKWNPNVWPILRPVLRFFGWLTAVKLLLASVVMGIGGTLAGEPVAALMVVLVYGGVGVGLIYWLRQTRTLTPSVGVAAAGYHHVLAGLALLLASSAPASAQSDLATDRDLWLTVYNAPATRGSTLDWSVGALDGLILVSPRDCFRTGSDATPTTLARRTATLLREDVKMKPLIALTIAFMDAFPKCGEGLRPIFQAKGSETAPRPAR
jgi:hypothetical protein